MNQLKNNNPFKLLIYILFLITCCIGFVLGYILLDMYDAGVFRGSTDAELQEEVRENYQDTMMQYCLDQGTSYIDSILSQYGLYDIEDGTLEFDNDLFEEWDVNNDNNIDETDVAKLIQREENEFDKNAYGKNLADNYGYTETYLSLQINNLDPIELAETGAVPEYSETLDYAESSRTYRIPSAHMFKYDTYQNAQRIGVETLGTDYDYVNVRMPENVAAINGSEMSESYGIMLNDSGENNYEEEVTADNSEINNVTEEEAESDSSGSYSTPEGTSISYDGNLITITENGKTQQYIYEPNDDVYYPVVKDGYIVILGNYGGLSVTINATGYLYVDDTSSVAPQIQKRMQAIRQASKDRNKILLYFGIDFILCIICMIASMALAGKSGTIRRVEKIPAEVILAAMFVLLIVLYALAQEPAFSISYHGDSYYYNSVRLHYFLDHNFTSAEIMDFICLLGLGCTCTLGLLLINNLIARVKMSNLMNTSLIVRLFRRLFGKKGKITSFFRYVGSKIPFIIKAILVYIVITIFEVIIIGLVGNLYGTTMLICLVVKLICAIAYIAFICTMQELFMGGDKLAKGEYSHKVNTRYMFGRFKEHGENLNHINEGVQLAVDERMKSERMKTELITNVSHDIKTPLTSIINYVDLLQKQNIGTEPEASYIEVIARQSARLKKLIVDLVDASKASTGNVKVELVNMDANMIAEQASGEYIDKLMQKNITLVTNLSKDRAGIEADGRHLWRVFDNLLNNAFKYTMPGTRLYVNTYITDEDGNVIRDLEKSIKEPAKVCIEFKNISEAPLNISSDELMERFVRGDSSRNTEGSGLGLSITRSLCQLQHADFNIVIDGDLFKAVITFAYCREPEEEQTTEEEQTMNPEADIED